MMYQYEIRPISSYDHWTLQAHGDNVSSIIDKLIRLAAKLTERFASDIVYSINDLQSAIQHWHKLDLVLFFNESAVRCQDIEEDGTVLYPEKIGACIQAWRLTYDPASITTTLQRVTLNTKINDYTTDRVGYSI